MKNFKDSILGLLEQLDCLTQSVTEEKTSSDLEFKDLLLLLSALLNSIKEKIITEQEEVKNILTRVKPVTEYLARKKNISKARQYHDDVINLCKDLNNNEFKSIAADHHLSISQLDSSQDIILKEEFIEEKEKIDELLGNLDHLCQAALLKAQPVEKEISSLKIKLISAANFQLVNFYPLSDEPVEKKAILLQQKAIENIITQSSKSENKGAGCHFVHSLILKTLKTKSYDIEWKKNLLCYLSYAYQLRKPDILPSDEKEDWKIYRIQLKESREKLNRQLIDGHLDRIDSEKRINAAHRYSADIKKLLQDIAAECSNLIYPPPLTFEFCLVALGSITRKELLPYSDLECLLLTGDSKDADWESNKASPAAKYLEKWFKLFQFYIVSLGESLNEKPGFRLDGYCDKVDITNLQLIKGNPSNPEFRKTVNGIIEAINSLTQDKTQTDPHSLYSLLSLDYISGNDQMKLFNDYHKKMQELTEDSHNTPLQQIAISQLTLFDQMYQKINEEMEGKTTPLKIKQHYWQLLTYPLYSLALYHNRIKFYDSKNINPPKSTTDIILLLEQNKLFSPEQAKKFQITLSDLYQIRFKLHQSAQFQKESYHSKSETILEKSELENLDRIKNEFLKVYYNAISAFLKTKKWSLNPLPKSFDDMLEIWKKHDEQIKSQNEEIKALKKEMGQKTKMSMISITPIYYILSNHLNKTSLFFELDKKTDSTCPLQSYIISYLDSLNRLMFVSLLYTYGKLNYKSEFLIDKLLINRSPNQKSLSPKTESGKKQKLQPMTTEGNGDCPFHAVLGEWNEFKNKYICSELEKKREAVQIEICKIADNDNKDECKPLQDLIVEGIKAATMDKISLGKNSGILLQSWQEFEKKQKNPNGWDKFHEELKKHSDIMEFINQYVPSGELLTASQYHIALTKENSTLRALILSLKDLEAARCAYDKERSQGFEWDSHLNSEIKKEYGQYFGKKGRWLLPHELGIIAIVFKVTVHFYAARNAIPQTYNPDQKKTVHVRFRPGHYERLEYVKSRRIPMEETALNNNSVKQYLRNELKIYEMECKTVHDETQTSIENYRQVSFNQFYTFCKGNSSKLQPKERREALMKLLCIAIENYGDGLSFVRTIHSDREKHATLSGGQTIQFKFALKDESRDIEEEIKEEISKLKKPYRILTIVINYSRDNKPALTGYIQPFKSKEFKKYTIKSDDLIKCIKKHILDSDFKRYKSQIEQQFWTQPSIRKKWQEASIQLIEEENWLITVYNNFQKGKKLESGYINNSWLKILQKSTGHGKSLRDELQQDEKLNPVLSTASSLLINFMLLSRLMGYAVLDYREDPDLDNHICQNKINKDLIEMSILVLKNLYRNLLSFRQMTHFGEISKISKFFTLIDSTIEEDICDRFDSAISLFYVVIKRIITIWGSRKNDQSRISRWSFIDEPWPEISRHIPGFGTMEFKERQQLINNLTIFRKELERNHDFSGIEHADVDSRLYRSCDNFFN